MSVVNYFDNAILIARVVNNSSAYYDGFQYTFGSVRFKIKGISSNNNGGYQESEKFHADGYFIAYLNIINVFNREVIYSGDCKLNYFPPKDEFSLTQCKPNVINNKYEVTHSIIHGKEISFIINNN